MNYCLILIIVLILQGCMQTETNIYPMENLFVDKLEKRQRREVYIISSPPKEEEVLLNLIREYNKETFDTSLLNKYNSIIRSFYKETRRLNSNYKENEPGFFTKKEIAAFWEEHLVYVSWVIYNGKLVTTYNSYVVKNKLRVFNDEGELIEEYDHRPEE